MTLKKTMLLILLMVLFSCFSLTVKAENKTSIDETILNEEITNVNFVSGTVVVMGNLSDNLTVDNFLANKITVGDSFFEEYNIGSIYVKNSDEMGQLTDNVTTGMKLVFETNDEATYEYEIKVVGDLNNDGIVNNTDVNMIIDDILKDKDTSVINDINGDGICDVLDVTYVLYSIDNNGWNVGNIEDIDLTSELSSLDEVYVGDVLEVTYKIKGYNSSKFKGISGILNYDKSLLELDSIFTYGDNGYLNSDGKFLYVIGNDEDEVAITIRFNVIAKGNTTISITDTLSSIDGVKTLEDTLSASHDIVIDEYGRGGDDEEVVEEAPVAAASSLKNETSVSSSFVRLNENYYVSNIVANVISLSSDNYIKSLEIKNYKINFDKDTLEYSIIVGNNVNSLDLSIVLNDEKASYDVIGNKDFNTGKNIVTIRVTAEDGSVRDYIINVNKQGSVKKEKSDGNGSKIAIIILIGLIIAGLIYVIFKDDEEENKDSKK